MTSVLLLLGLLFHLADGDPGPRTWARDLDPVVYLDLDLTSVRHRVDRRFLSVTIDASLAEEERFMSLLSSVKLQTLSRALSPAFLRFGGTRQDFMTFQPPRNQKQPDFTADESCGQIPWWQEEKLRRNWAQYQEILIKEDLKASYRRIQFTALTVDRLYSFSTCCGLDLVFGLNALLRTSNNSWNGSNAAQLLQYCQSRRYQLDWELGNEPNSFRKKAGVMIDGQQLALDFSQLRRTMSGFQLYRHAGLYGPDVGQPRDRRSDLLEGFLQTGAQSVNAVTWHHYYVNGRETSLKDFLDPEVLDTLSEKITEVLEKVKRASPSRPVWLGESSSAFGGGAPGLSNTFVAGFMWLDKLGLAASMGLDVVMRQALVGAGRYQLVDPDLDPLPDYWLSLLYKRLVGPEVLKVRVSSQRGRNKQIRVYLHCANRKSSSSGALVLLAMNLSEKSVIMLLPSSTSRGPVEAFVLQSDQPGEGGVCSRSVMLNGAVLKMVDDQTFPELRGARLPPADRLKLPPFSLAFYLFPEARATVCI